MWPYILRRLLLAIPTLLGVTVVVFLIMRVAPGDVALMIICGPAGDCPTDPAIFERLRAELGLDRPLYIQYFDWLYGMVTLDLGDRTSTTRRCRRCWRARRP